MPNRRRKRSKSRRKKITINRAEQHDDNRRIKLWILRITVIFATFYALLPGKFVGGGIIRVIINTTKWWIILKILQNN